MFTYMMGKGVAPTVELPAGAIIPLTGGGAVPSGWTIWSTADSKYIIGAGSTLAVGATGGGNALGVTIVATPTHTLGDSGFRGGGGSWAGLTPDGIHNHPGSTVSLAHPYYGMRLIKLNSAGIMVPQYGVTMFHSGSIPGGLTQYAVAGDPLFQAVAGSSSGGSTTPLCSLAADGVHNHGGHEGGSTGGSQGGNWKGQTPGTHVHTRTMAITFNVYRRSLHLAYPNVGAVDINDFDNPIILYESITPPAGWALCDGTNGTPSMEYRHIRITTIILSPGVAYGDGTVSDTVGGASTNLGNHDHDNNDKCGDCSSDQAYHAGIAGAHTHAVTLPAVAWNPAYYGLAFMMKL